MKLLRCEISGTDIVTFINVDQIVTITHEDHGRTAIVTTTCEGEERYIVDEPVEIVIENCGGLIV